MSLANTAIIGAIWSVATRLGARLVGLVGTLLITRFLSPEIMGEVGVAVVTVLTAQYVSDFAFGQYIVVKSQNNKAAIFHAFVYNIITLAIAALVLLLMAATLGDLLGSGSMTRYLPVMVLSLAFERLTRIPESVALRELRFKLFSIVTSVTELVYVGVSLSMAAAGYGGDAIVWANVAQWGTRWLWFSLAVKRPMWFSPVAITWKETKALFRFGIPLSIGNAAHFASSAWDRIIITGLFGHATHGVYSLGKSLSAVPADNIGDAVADVLMPSFVRMTPEEARIAVIKACHFVAIVVSPLAAGLAVVSPTLVEALFTPEWQAIALPLTILAAVSIIDPMGDTMTSYLKARDMPWAVMVIQLGYLAVMLGTTYLLGREFGLYGACFGVGAGMTFRALVALFVASYLDQVSIPKMLVGITRAALASGLMVLAVLGVRVVLTGDLDNIFLALAIEIVVGAVSYPPAAFLVARPIVSEVITWVRNRRSGDDDEDNDDEEEEASKTELSNS